MGKLLIIKTGSTYESVIKKYGDYESMITEGIGISSEDTEVIPVYRNARPYIHEGISSIIITGSSAMVTDMEPWCVFTANWLNEIIHKKIPILGICFGHQLLAKALGGSVDYHPKGQEYGEVKIQLAEEGRKDPVLGILPSEFSGYVAHSQTVTRLPENTRVLARNDFESSHALAFGDNIWGVQFHPEFNAGIAKIHIDEEKDELLKNGQDISKLYASIQGNPYGPMLLKRFFEISNLR
ncbi:MAG TPA: glutamine amidotransferase [Clostridia bacterium]